MENTCYAAIDIGSNAARLLIKKQNPKDRQKKFTKLLLLRVPLRLGFDVFKSQEISEKKAKKLGNDKLVAMYTMAVRQARTSNLLYA